ncbi:MAG: nucleotidyl transferase AbiEii/AbiGii toxin family protein [Verrucomicrobiales bacterium]
MTNLAALAADLQQFCEQHRWKFCFIGGLALQHWGEPRFTKDVDMTLLTGFGNEEKFVDLLLARFEGRVANPKEFALRNRVLLLKSTDGIGIDIAMGALPFEESAVRRASDIELMPALILRLCSPEDLIVMKTFANRDQDWIDVRGILVRQGANLDWKYVFAELAPLAELKEMPELVDRLEKLRQTLP